MKGVIIGQNTIHFKIDKPLYDDYVGIRDIYLKMKKKLVIKAGLQEDGGYKYRGICSATEWKKTGELKKQFKYRPNEPMILYFNHVSRFAEKKIDPVGIGFNVRLKMLENWKKIKKSHV